MPPTSDQDLSTLAAEEPLQEWAVLGQKLRETKLSPLDAWKGQYGRWRELYSRFRELEQDTLFKAVDDGRPIKASDDALRFHREVITLLLDAGDSCEKALVSLHPDDGEADERRNCHVRMETLLASLRESVELWHSAGDGQVKSFAISSPKVRGTRPPARGDF